ncbi:MAG: transporter, partial [Winogradskyella sp.]|nr:transporter [Winogradskyella sp.]
MKNILMIFISVLVVSITNAQDINDALRYSFDEIEGTARFKAMGGAFGALGGDLSAININPAGAAVFNSSQASLSLGVFNKDNTVGYFNGLSTASNSNVDLNQTGAAFVFRNYSSNSPWKKFVLSIAYDRFNDFDHDWVANGTNPNNSIGDYFLQYAQGQRLDEISAFPGETISEAYSEIGSFYGFGNQQAFLGYESFIIDPVDDTDENTVYTSNISGTNFNQRYVYASRGYNGKLAFNFA